MATALDRRSLASRAWPPWAARTPQKVQSLGVVRLAVEDLAVELFRLAEAAGFMVAGAGRKLRVVARRRGIRGRGRGGVVLGVRWHRNRPPESLLCLLYPGRPARAGAAAPEVPTAGFRGKSGGVRNGARPSQQQDFQDLHVGFRKARPQRAYFAAIPGGVLCRLPAGDRGLPRLEGCARAPAGLSTGGRARELRGAGSGQRRGRSGRPTDRTAPI